MTTERQRMERAERAAAGACGHVMGYVRATDLFMQVWASEESSTDEKIVALEGLRLAHNAALDWAKAESARIHERTTEVGRG